jgi:hypothetical protein
MPNRTLYSYRLAGRRPATIFIFVISLVLLVFATPYVDTWYILLPIGLSAAMALWAIIQSPKTGSTLTTETLHFFNRGAEEIVQIKEIASMRVEHWSDGPDTVTLTLTSGRVIHVSSLCADSKLAVVLREVGITET